MIMHLSNSSMSLDMICGSDDTAGENGICSPGCWDPSDKSNSGSLKNASPMLLLSYYLSL